MGTFEARDMTVLEGELTAVLSHSRGTKLVVKEANSLFTLRSGTSGIAPGSAFTLRALSVCNEI